MKFTLLLALSASANAISISEIQGNKWITPYLNKKVGPVAGVVTAIDDGKGFFIQDPSPDNDPRTSEGIYVSLKEVLAYSVGDYINIGSATATEFAHFKSKDANSITNLINPINITLIAAKQGRKITAKPIHPPTQLLYNVNPLEMTEPVNVQQQNKVLDLSRGLDYFESLEGMLVTIPNPLAVSRTSRYGGFWVVPNGGMNATGMNERGGITINAFGKGGVDVNPEKILVGSPIEKGSNPSNIIIGTTLDDIVGVVNFAFGSWQVRPLVRPQVRSIPTVNGMAPPMEGDRRRKKIFKRAKRTKETCQELPFATFNVENLHPNNPKIAKIAQNIAIELHSPYVVALQEVQDNDGPVDSGTVACDQTMQRLVDEIVNAGGARYSWLVIDPENKSDGGQPGGNIRQAFLYRPDQVRVSESTQMRQGSSGESQQIISTGNGVMFNVNPGRIDPMHSAFARSRKPLSVQFDYLNSKIIFINNHLSSKMGSGSMFGIIQPPKNGGVQSRLNQALRVRQYVDEILANDPNARVVVLGDFNEFAIAPPMLALSKGGALVSLMEHLLKPEERYTYVFDGNSQALDHIFVTSNLLNNAQVEPVHLNTWDTYRRQSSDHDPLFASICL